MGVIGQSTAEGGFDRVGPGEGAGATNPADGPDGRGERGGAGTGGAGCGEGSAGGRVPRAGRGKFPKKKNGFPRQARLTDRQDFQRLRRPERRVVSTHFIVALSRRPGIEALSETTGAAATMPRLGLIVSRKVGGAVKRNRIKRLIREFFRLHQNRLPAGYDLVVIARPGADKLRAPEVFGELSRVLGLEDGDLKRRS